MTRPFAAGQHMHLGPLCDGDLRRQVGARPEAVDAQAPPGRQSRAEQRPVPDDARTQQGSHLLARQAVWYAIRVGRGDGRVLGVAPIGIPPGEERANAKVLGTPPAPCALAARASKPRDAHSVTDREPADPSPTWATSPTTSWPGTTAGRWPGRSPSAMWRSVRHTPHTSTRTRSSSGSGSGTWRVTSRIRSRRRVAPVTSHARIVGGAASGTACAARGLVL